MGDPHRSNNLQKHQQSSRPHLSRAKIVCMDISIYKNKKKYTRPYRTSIEQPNGHPFDAEAKSFIYLEKEALLTEG